MSAKEISVKSFLSSLRWGLDSHAINYEGEHVWFGPCEQGGFTDCCLYGYECDRHKPLITLEDMKATPTEH